MCRYGFQQNLAVDHFIQSKWSQKTFDRASKELPIDIRLHEISFKDDEVISKKRKRLQVAFSNEMFNVCKNDCNIEIFKFWDV